MVEDVAYRELGFEDASLSSLWSIGPDVVVQAGTTSKTFCPGVRLGWAVGPAEVARRLVAAKQLTDQCAGALGQRLFEESERRGWIDEQLTRSRELYRRKGERMLMALKRSMPQSARWTTPHGGFFSWLTLPGADAVELAQRSVEQGVPPRRERSSSLTGAARTASASRSAWSTSRGSTRGSRAWGRSRERAHGHPLPLGGPGAKEPLKDDLSRRLISTERMMLAQVFLEKGASSRSTRTRTSN